MGLDQLGVLTVGTLVPKQGGHALLHSILLVVPPWSRKHRSSSAPQAGYFRAYPMQHVVNKPYTRWLAANLISGHLVHAGNHRHGSAGHNLDRYWTSKAADVQVFRKPIPIAGGC